MAASSYLVCAGGALADLRACSFVAICSTLRLLIGRLECGVAVYRQSQEIRRLCIQDSVSSDYFLREEERLEKLIICQRQRLKD